MSESIKLSSLSAPAPLKRRLAALFYEAILLFAIATIIALVFSIITQSKHGLQNRVPLMIVEFILIGIYLSYCWHKGQTLAMKTWKIRLVSKDNANLSLPHAFIRYILSWVWILPPLAFASLFDLTFGKLFILLIGWVIIWTILARFAPRSQFWHDIIVGAELIDTRSLNNVENGKL